MFENDEFDLFIAQHVIEEIEDYESALDEIARVLGRRRQGDPRVRFDSKRERLECHDPNHFGNVWEFGADLLDQLGERFDEVEELPFTEDGYSGTFRIRRHSPTPTGSPGRPPSERSTVLDRRKRSCPATRNGGADARPRTVPWKPMCLGLRPNHGEGWNSTSAPSRRPLSGLNPPARLVRRRRRAHRSNTPEPGRRARRPTVCAGGRQWTVGPLMRLAGNRHDPDQWRLDERPVRGQVDPDRRRAQREHLLWSPSWSERPSNSEPTSSFRCQ